MRQVTVEHKTLKDKDGKPRRYITNERHAELLAEAGWTPVDPAPGDQPQSATPPTTKPAAGSKEK